MDETVVARMQSQSGAAEVGKSMDLALEKSHREVDTEHRMHLLSCLFMELSL